MQTEYPIAPDALLFAQTFPDGTTDAELALGNFRAEHIEGKLAFSEGRRNRALQCGAGGAALSYPVRNNLSFRKPGTLLLWFRPVDWPRTLNAPRVLLWSMMTDAGKLSLQIAGEPRHLCACRRPLQLVLSGKSGEVKNLWTLPAPEGAEHRCGAFQMVALAWTPTHLYLSWNGTPFQEYQWKERFGEQNLPGTLFSVGSSRFWRYDLDELYIYGRKLTDSELKTAFDAGNRIR